MSSSTSAVYDAAIYAPVRRTVATIGFDLAPPEAKKRATVTSPAGNVFSRAKQLMNGIQEVGAPIATFEKDYWRLDGRFVLPVAPDGIDYEIGWWGKNMSDASGQVPQPCEFMVEFATVQKIPALGLAFDTKAHCAIADFDVFFYNTGGIVIFQQLFRNNMLEAVETSGGAEQVKRIRIVVRKTVQPHRFPRICEINFGLRLRFDGELLISSSLVTEADPMGESVPFPRLQVTVRNDGRFNVLAKDDLSKYLQNRQTLEYQHGVHLADGKIEFVYGGIYYLDGWRISDDRVVFEAAGASSLLDCMTYKGKSLTLLTVGELMDLVLSESDLTYQIAESLFQSPKVCAYLGEMSIREAVKHVAMLAGAMVYEDRRNKLCVLDLLTEEQASDRIDYENMLEAPALRQSPYYNGIWLTEYTVRADNTTFDSEEIFYPAPWYVWTEPRYGYPLNVPCMVTNKNPQYGALRDWVLARRFALLARRITAEANWRQNPALAVGDAVEVQANKHGVNVQARVVYSALDFAEGVLSGETKTLFD